MEVWAARATTLVAFATVLGAMSCPADPREFLALLLGLVVRSPINLIICFLIWGGFSNKTLALRFRELDKRSWIVFVWIHAVCWFRCRAEFRKSWIRGFEVPPSTCCCCCCFCFCHCCCCCYCRCCSCCCYCCCCCCRWWRCCHCCFWCCFCYCCCCCYCRCCCCCCYCRCCSCCCYCCCCCCRWWRCCHCCFWWCYGYCCFNYCCSWRPDMGDPGNIHGWHSLFLHVVVFTVLILWVEVFILRICECTWWIPNKRTNKQKTNKHLALQENGVAVRGETRHRGNTLFCRAVTSILSQRLLHKMTSARQFW